MDWKSVVKSVAPVLGTALGGPLGGGAAKYIADKFLGDESLANDEQALSQAIIGATPEQLAELKRIDNEYKLAMEQAGIDVFKLEVEDRKSARDLAKADMRPVLGLSIVYTLAYVFVLWNFMAGNVEVAEDMKILFGSVLGILSTAQAQILNFWFGSSAGSRDKDSKLGVTA